MGTFDEITVEIPTLESTFGDLKVAVRALVSKREVEVWPSYGVALLCC